MINKRGVERSMSSLYMMHQPYIKRRANSSGSYCKRSIQPIIKGRLSELALSIGATNGGAQARSLTEPHIAKVMTMSEMSKTTPQTSRVSHGVRLLQRTTRKSAKQTCDESRRVYNTKRNDHASTDNKRGASERSLPAPRPWERLISETPPSCHKGSDNISDEQLAMRQKSTASPLCKRKRAISQCFPL